MDGHTSRENTLALYILKLINTNVLILPSQCTHILQMLDTVLAAQFINKFAKLFDKLFNTKRLLEYKSFASLIIQAWNEICIFITVGQQQKKLEPSLKI